MSLSEPKLQNPCKKFIEFKGDKGVFQYWSKEKEKNIELKTPFQFIVLDELSTITGFSEQTASGIYSNEVHSLNQTLNVRTFKGGVSLVGKYADIKDRIKAMKGKFTKSVYAAMIWGDGLELVNFQLKGAAFSAWMDKTVETEISVIHVENFTDGKKGKVEYKIPVYEGREMSEALRKKAVEMDRELQEFLRSYMKKNKVEEGLDVQEAMTPNLEEEEEDGIPF